jgi:sec-independent protein translocase protein TatB
MFNVGGGELLVIALVALIVLGPQRLPEAARTVGKVVGEIRRLSSGFQREIRDAFEDSEPVRRRPEPAPLASAVADIDADEPNPLDDLPGADQVGDDEPAAPGVVSNGAADATGTTETAAPPSAANGDAPAGEPSGTGGGGRRPGPGELAPEVGDALDQVAAVTPATPTTPPSPATDDGREAGSDSDSDERPPGDARAAS